MAGLFFRAGVGVFDTYCRKCSSREPISGGTAERYWAARHLSSGWAHICGYRRSNCSGNPVVGDPGHMGLTCRSPSVAGGTRCVATDYAVSLGSRCPPLSVVGSARCVVPVRNVRWSLDGPCVRFCLHFWPTGEWLEGAESFAARIRIS